MPFYHNDILIVTKDELQECGISGGYINRALSGQRAGQVYCWEHHKKGNKVFMHYHTLKPKYQVLVKKLLCGGLEPEIWLKKRDENKAQKSIENLTDQITRLIQSDPDEIKVLTEKKIYSPTEVHQIARAAGWLRLINEFDVKKSRKIGFNSINDFRNEAFKRCLNEQTAKPTPLIKFKKGTINNVRWLVENAAVNYKNEGINSLIHGGVGNVNREKSDTEMHAKLITLASNPVKFSFEDIAMMFNDWALENNKEQLTTSAVKQYLNTPKIKKVWFYSRHGKHAADNELQSLINRETPSFPDALWSLDGTTMQLYYRDDNGDIKSDLYTYFVTDANTGAIIGKAVAFAETAGLVDAALRDAINTHGYKPYQLQYDNSSANIAVATQNLMTNMSRVHFPCEPYKGRSKYVEAIIGHFQQRVLRKLPNFKGGNITSKSLNSKANPELLAYAKKNPELFPDREGVLKIFNESVNDWNARGEKRDNYGRWIGQSKIVRYTTTIHEKRAKTNYFDKISLFMVEQRLTYSYGVNGIVIELNGNKHHFIVPDPDVDTVGDFLFANDNLGKKFKVKIDRESPNMIALYNEKGVFIDFAYKKERYAACLADIKDGQKAKERMFKLKQEEFGQLYSKRELEKQLQILGELKATGTDGFGWWDTTKTNTNAREAVLEDAANGMSDGLTDRQRKILNIGK